jgi:hypothetical protein
MAFLELRLGDYEVRGFHTLRYLHLSDTVALVMINASRLIA